ncbi:MAG: cation:proton antiporter subunit C [Acidobacteriota bacterium]|jgi:multicomponent Na+:H+ antiporter subunit C|nr:cation:proton antiporter subunit C [Acidobacteriota bacterium]
MLDFFVGHYAYWFAFILMAIGLYGMMIKNNLVKKLIGMTIFQVSIILFYVAAANKWGATVPVLDAVKGPLDPAHYINPLPHTLMLTAIVVGVATLGVALALVITIFKRYQTLDETRLLAEMRKDDDSE